VEHQDIDSLFSEIRKKVVKGSKPSRPGRLRSCLRVLDPTKASDVGQSSVSEAWDEKLHPRDAGRFAPKPGNFTKKPGGASSAGYSDAAVAGEILKQIKHGMSPLDYLSMGIKNVYALGSDDKVAGSEATGGGLQFDARGHWKGRVIARLGPDDTYALIFGRIRGSKWKIDKELAGIYADSIGEVVRNNVLGNGIREDTENTMNLSDAISAFRSINEANIPAPAVNRPIPGGKQTSSKSKFDQYKGADKQYDGKAASVPSDAEAMAAATNSTAGVKGPGYNGSGREKVDTRIEMQEDDGVDLYENNDSNGDLAFAQSMLEDKIGYYPTMETLLAEQNLAAPAVSRKTPDGKAQISSKSKFRQPKGKADQKYNGSPAQIQADKEAMDAAMNSTDGVSGEGYTPDGREETDVRVE